MSAYLETKGNAINCGLDVGYRAVKEVAANKAISFSSIVGTPNRSRVQLTNGDAFIVRIKGREYMIGDDAINFSRITTRQEDRNWIETPEYYALVLAAFTELTEAPFARLNLVTGLPVDYYEDRHRLAEILYGEHEVERDGRPKQRFVIDRESKSLRVTMQPIGSLVSVGYDDDGNYVDRSIEGYVGGIDIGAGTTDFTTMRGMWEVAVKAGSLDTGGWDLVRDVAGALSDKYPALRLSDSEVEHAVVSGYVKRFGEQESISDLVKELAVPLEEEIVARAQQLWGKSAEELDAIFVTGGGAHLIGGGLQRHFKHARIVEQPVFANAIGYFRLAQRLSK